MNRNLITVEQVLYIVAFLLAISVRFQRLGAAPLSNFEAGWALQAFQVSNREIQFVGAQPGYVMLTGLMFFIFGSTTFLARFWPALLGSALVGVPFIFSRDGLLSHKLGKIAALVMAFGIAIDPGLVAFSRLAGGPMIALSFGLLSLGMIYLRRPIIAGMLAGLSLLGGSAALQGIIGLALAWGIWKLISRNNKPDLIENPQDSIEEQNREMIENSDKVDGEKRLNQPPYLNWRVFLLAGGLTILLLSSLFLFIPQGLSGLAGFLTTYINGWSIPSGIPVLRVVAGLVFYEPLALLLGLVTILRAWIGKDQISRWLSLWFITALVLMLLYPGRQIADIVWALIPLWGLAAMELAYQFKTNERDRIPALGQAALSIILFALAWINLSALTRAGSEDRKSVV
jgi:hypothetical protein